jgi:hypothetical protein
MRMPFVVITNFGPAALMAAFVKHLSLTRPSLICWRRSRSTAMNGAESVLMNALLPLIGVVIGAVASYVAGAAAEQRRWRRESQVRWDTKRLDAYAGYANTVKTFIHVANRVSAARGVATAAQPIAVDEGLEQLAQAEAERGSAWERVLLLGDPDAIAAARRWHEGAWRLEYFARGFKDDMGEWEQAMTEANQARQDFYACARIDLGITGTPPVSVWPRRPLPSRTNPAPEPGPLSSES